MTFFKKGLLLFFFSKIGSIEIPKSVTEIQKDAFFNLNNITSILIPGKVEIKKGNFNYCRKLVEVTFLSDETNVDDDCFNGCENLSPDSIEIINNHKKKKSDSGSHKRSSRKRSSRKRSSRKRSSRKRGSHKRGSRKRGSRKRGSRKRKHKINGCK